jgi:hypothetical protein
MNLHRLSNSTNRRSPEWHLVLKSSDRNSLYAELAISLPCSHAVNV